MRNQGPAPKPLAYLTTPAKEFGADETGKTFLETFKSIARHKPGKSSKENRNAWAKLDNGPKE